MMTTASSEVRRLRPISTLLLLLLQQCQAGKWAMPESGFPSSRARSCKNCANAKAKCYGFVDSKCERCSRLHKECVMQTVAQRPKPAKITRTAQIAQLERKLDGLVNILTKPAHAVVAHDASSINAAHSLAGLAQTPKSGASPNDLPTYSDSNTPHTIDSVGKGDVHAPTGAFGSPGCPFKDVFVHSINLAAPDIHDATPGCVTPDELLQLFHTHLARQVPFITVSKEISALQLQEQRPFLYRSIIMAASCNDASHQIALGAEILKSFSEAFLVRGEKSLDLMQGLLVFLSWYQYNFHLSTQINNLLSLMNALLVDLGLHRPSLNNGKLELFISDMKRAFHKDAHAQMRGLERGGPKVMDERRATLGCFYLSSCITSFTSSSYVDAIRAVPYIEECCRVVEADGEEPNDAFLVQLSRLQILNEKIRLSGAGDIASSPEDSLSRLSLSMYIRTFQAELRSFFDSVPADLREDRSLLAHYHITSMHLYGLGFYMPPTTSHMYPNGSKMRRADVLHALLLATKAFFDEFLPIPPERYFTLSIVHCGQVMYAMAKLAKMSLFKAEDWDLCNFRATIDLASIEEQVISRMEQAASIFESNEENGLWSISARRLRKVRALSCDKEKELSSAEAVEDHDAQAALIPDSFDVFDDTFWQGLSGDAWQFVD